MLECSVIQNLLETNGRPDDVAMLFERMLLTDEHPDTSLGCPDGNKGFEFC